MAFKASNCASFRDISALPSLNNALFIESWNLFISSMSSVLKRFAHAQKHRISTVCGEDNGLCQSPSFLGPEELGSGYEIGYWPVNCFSQLSFRLIETLNWLLRPLFWPVNHIKMCGACCAAEWPCCLFAKLWFSAALQIFSCSLQNIIIGSANIIIDCQNNNF